MAATLTMISATCGDDSATGTSPERLPPREFELRVARLCSAYERAWVEWGEQFEDDPTSVDLDAAVRRAHQIARRVADDLMRIEPEGREDAWRRATRRLDAGLDAAAKNDPPELRHADIRAARITLIDEFGAKGCFA